MEVAKVLKTPSIGKLMEYTHFRFKQVTARNTHLATLFNKLIEVGQLPGVNQLRPEVNFQGDLLVIQDFPKFLFQKSFADKIE